MQKNITFFPPNDGHKRLHVQWQKENEEESMQLAISLFFSFQLIIMRLATNPPYYVIISDWTILSNGKSFLDNREGGQRNENKNLNGFCLF